MPPGSLMIYRLVYMPNKNTEKKLAYTNKLSKQKVTNTKDKHTLRQALVHTSWSLILRTFWVFLCTVSGGKFPSRA